MEFQKEQGFGHLTGLNSCCSASHFSHFLFYTKGVGIQTVKEPLFLEESRSSHVKALPGGAALDSCSVNITSTPFIPLHFHSSSAPVISSPFSFFSFFHQDRRIDEVVGYR